MVAATNAHGLATDCRVEYRIGDDFVLEFLAASDGFGAVAAHFARCAEALAGVGPLLISVDGVDLDASHGHSTLEASNGHAAWAAARATTRAMRRRSSETAALAASATGGGTWPRATASRSLPTSDSQRTTG